MNRNRRSRLLHYTSFTLAFVSLFAFISLLRLNWNGFDPNLFRYCVSGVFSERYKNALNEIANLNNDLLRALEFLEVTADDLYNVAKPKHEVQKSDVKITNQPRETKEETMKETIDMMKTIQRQIELKVKVIDNLGEENSLQEGFPERGSSREVCPEIFEGTTKGYPFFYTGWATTRCKHAQPLKDLVTVVIVENDANTKNAKSELVQQVAYFNSYLGSYVLTNEYINLAV